MLPLLTCASSVKKILLSLLITSYIHQVRIPFLLVTRQHPTHPPFNSFYPDLTAKSGSGSKIVGQKQGKRQVAPDDIPFQILVPGCISIW